MGEKIIKSNDFYTRLLILIFYKIFDCTIKLIVFLYPLLIANIL